MGLFGVHSYFRRLHATKRNTMKLFENEPMKLHFSGNYGLNFLYVLFHRTFYITLLKFYKHNVVTLLCKVIFYSIGYVLSSSKGFSYWTSFQIVSISPSISVSIINEPL